MEIFSRIFPLFRTVYPSKRIRMSLPIFCRNSLVIRLNASTLELARYVLNCTKRSFCTTRVRTFSSSASFCPATAMERFFSFSRLSFKECKRSSGEVFSISRIVLCSVSIAHSAACISSDDLRISRLMAFCRSSMSPKTSSKTFRRMLSISFCSAVMSAVVRLRL